MERSNLVAVDTNTGRTSSAYVPRRPEASVLYRAVAGELETFLVRASERDRTVPRFVEREFRTFLDCGILAHGFLRVRCDECRCERLVPFSCKGRGFCPSCGGRRMADTAAHLVDRVFPVVPVRQWVLTVPWALRYRMAYDAVLTSTVLRELVRAVFASLRRRARRGKNLGPKPRCGAVTFVQRFGDALNLNVHFHSLILDGVFDGERFRPLPPPDDHEVLRVGARIARRLAHVLRKRGLDRDGDPMEVDPLFREEPLLASLAGASVRGRIATGRRAGQAVLRLGDRIDAEDLGDAIPESSRCATIGGVSLHANVCVPARDRQRLERLCRYVARPPLSGERLSVLDDGRFLYRLKRRWRDGTTHMVFEPLELIEKLAALVPPPRINLVRYHGVLAPAARNRAGIVPGSAVNNQTRTQDGCTCRRHDAGASHPGPPRRDPVTGVDPAPGSGAMSDAEVDFVETKPHPRHYTWRELMRRVFAVDVLECPRCHGPMRILAQIHPPDTTRAILECLGLPIRPPPVADPKSGSGPPLDAFDDIATEVFDPLT
jgi:hypothetical protein